MPIHGPVDGLIRDLLLFEDAENVILWYDFVILSCCNSARH
jgi:hypothetical protein